MLIGDLIAGKENRWEKIYEPGRTKWISAGGTFFKEFVGGMIAYYRHMPDSDPAQLATIQPNEGKVIKYKGEKCGVFKDTDGSLHVVSAVCTHLQCTVKWNGDEKTWDCPCHGSRFTVEGKVLNGPANDPLPYIGEKELHELMPEDGK